MKEPLMARKNKYSPKSKEILTKDNCLRLLSYERDDKYTFLEDYVKSTQAVLTLCNDCKNEWRVAPYELIKRGSNCPNCLTRGESIRTDDKTIKQKLFNKYSFHPYTFLEPLKGTTKKVKAKCNTCKNNIEIIPNNALYNEGSFPPCKFCATARSVKALSISSSELVDRLVLKFGKNPYTIVKYTSMESPASLKCNSCEHTFETNLAYVFNKKTAQHYCPNCNKHGMHNTNTYEDHLEGSGIIALAEFKSTKKKILHKCLTCETIWDSLPRKDKLPCCPNCNKIKTVSKLEMELHAFIKSIYTGKILFNKKSIIPTNKRLELDIFIPDLKIAIEFNGLYWHNEQRVGKTSHLEKLEACEASGIQLLQIFEDEWLLKQDIVKTRIQNVLNTKHGLAKLNAAKCKVREINKVEKKLFLERNHLEGNSKSAFNLAMFLKDEIVAVMAINTKEEKSLEIVRFATDINFVIDGAFEHLLQHLLDNFEGFSRILLSVDRRWDNSLYDFDNFEIAKINAPSFWYFDKNTNSLNMPRYKPSAFTKEKIAYIFPEIYDEELSAFELMDKTSYRRIWDCGRKVLVYNV